MVPASEGTGHIDSRPDISINDVHHSNHEHRISPSRLDDTQIEALRNSLLVLQRENDRLVRCHLRLAKTIEEVTEERDELVAQRDEEFREKLQVQVEFLVRHGLLLELFKEKKSKQFQLFSECFTLLESVEECLMRIVERIGSDAGKETLPNTELKQDDELIMFMSKTRHVHSLAETLETNMLQQEERGRKEKKQLELSIISLTEENRDISSLLRIAIVEKEAAEKAIERLKGGDQQKRAALLQYAEMGLQKVGFGFIMGAPAGDLTENTGSTVNSIDSSSECEEEGVNSLVYVPLLSLILSCNFIFQTLQIYFRWLHYSQSEQ